MFVAILVDNHQPAEAGPVWVSSGATAEDAIACMQDAYAELQRDGDEPEIGAGENAAWEGIVAEYRERLRYSEQDHSLFVHDVGDAC